jgi:hypothetical protein
MRGNRRLTSGGFFSGKTKLFSNMLQSCHFVVNYKKTFLSKGGDSFI